MAIKNPFRLCKDLRHCKPSSGGLAMKSIEKEDYKYSKVQRKIREAGIVG